jgi:hypothetical protein
MQLHLIRVAAVAIDKPSATAAASITLMVRSRLLERLCSRLRQDKKSTTVVAPGLL